MKGLKNLDEYVVTGCLYHTEDDGISPDKPDEDTEVLNKIRKGTHLWMKSLTDEEKEFCGDGDVD